MCCPGAGLPRDLCPIRLRILCNRQPGPKARVAAHLLLLQVNFLRLAMRMCNEWGKPLTLGNEG